MSIVLSLKPLPLALAISLLAAPVLFAAEPAHAQTLDNPPDTATRLGPQARHPFDLPAQPLAHTLTQIAEAGQARLSLDAALVRNLQAPPVRGELSIEDAWHAALSGSGLTIRRTGSGAWTVEKGQQDSVTSLAPIMIQGAHPATTEGSMSYTTGSMSTATRLPLSIRETPQSVTVITRQRIEDQGLGSLSDVVQATPGLTLTRWGGERYRFTSRNFQINTLMVDGLPIQYEEAALSTGALSMYDRVEVMRGAAGLMEGAGTPGGSINLVRKRPTDAFQGEFTASAGSWDNGLGSLDMGGPINAAGTLRGRTVFSYQDKGSFIDEYHNKRTLFYGILEADLTPSLTATLGASYSKEDNPGVDWNGRGTWPDGHFLDIPRSQRMSPDWSYWDRRSTTLFADIEYRLDNGWIARAAATTLDSRMSMLGTFIRGNSVNARGQPVIDLGGGAYKYDRTQRSLDVSLSGQYGLWGQSHDFVLGASYRRSRWNDTGGPATQSGNFTIGTFNPLTGMPDIALPQIGWGLWSRQARMTQTSAYGSTRAHLGEATHLILGGRLDWYENNQIQYDGDWPYGGTRQKASRRFTPYIGLVRDLDEHHSVYASWTSIFNPESYPSADGGTLPPQVGHNYELGLKGEYLDGRLNASIAIFRIDLENLPDELPIIACPQGMNSCYQSAGKVRSQGFELEIGGELLPGWQLAAGYTYASAKRRGNASGYDPIGTYTIGKRYATNIPRRQFKLSTTYRLPGDLNRWRIGASLHAQDAISSPWGPRQGGYATVGLHAGYAASRQLDFSLNVNNLFDRKYYSDIGSHTDANFVGDPLNVLLTARYRF